MYVDDIIITSASNAEIDILKSHLDATFKLKDLGVLRYFLGLEITRSSKGISLSQWNYTLQLLEDHDLLACKPSSLPLDIISSCILMLTIYWLILLSVED